MATAVIGPIRRALNASQLDVLAAPWAAPMFEAHPSVDEVISVATPWWLATRGASLRARIGAWRSLPQIIRQIRNSRYDVGVDLRGDLRQIVFFLVLGGCQQRVSSDRTGGAPLLTRVVEYVDELHEVAKNLAVARLLGVDEDVVLDPPRLPEIPRSIEEEVESVAGERGYVTLSIRGTGRSRNWPVQNAARFVDAAAELGIGTVYVGGDEDRLIADGVAEASSVPMAVLAGKQSLMESLAVIAGATAAVAVDSGPMHLAALVGTPVVGLFGPSDPTKFHPWTRRSDVLSIGAPCDCVQPNCDFTTDGPGACMTGLEPRAVLDAVVKLIAEK